MLDENQLQRLLRLKRHEQPPPEYFETFLDEFHRRQRGEMLKQPLWQIAWERLQAAVALHSPGRYAYATVVAVAIMLAGVLTFDGSNPADSHMLAETTPAFQQPTFAYDTQVNAPRLHAQFATPVSSHLSDMQPRYVIDVRPVSYEPAFSF
jgi:hypothetical protein